jgi:hypothetical protein
MRIAMALASLFASMLLLAPANSQAKVPPLVNNLFFLLGV